MSTRPNKYMPHQGKKECARRIRQAQVSYDRRNPIVDRISAERFLAELRALRADTK